MNETRQELMQTLENSIRLLQQEIERDPQQWTPGRGGRSKILIVTMPDGRPIRRASQAKTFGAVIESLGVEDVKDLSIRVGAAANSNALVSTSRAHSTCYPSGQYYIFTNMNIENKIRLLREIAGRLGVPLVVEGFQRIADD